MAEVPAMCGNGSRLSRWKVMSFQEQPQQARQRVGWGVTQLAASSVAVCCLQLQVLLWHQEPASFIFRLPFEHIWV